MREIIYYIKAFLYFLSIFYFEKTDVKIACAGLAILMLFFALDISIKNYIDKKWK